MATLVGAVTRPAEASDQLQCIPRQPGVSLLFPMISLCPKCRAKVERTQMVLSEMNPLLLELWREKHPQGLEQFVLGQNVNSYHDREGKRSYWQRSERCRGSGRLGFRLPIRIISPSLLLSDTQSIGDFTPDIVAAIDAMPTLCDHVYFPVQSRLDACAGSAAAGAQARGTP
jgi:hypothetical protein